MGSLGRTPVVQLVLPMWALQTLWEALRFPIEPSPSPHPTHFENRSSTFLSQEALLVQLSTHVCMQDDSPLQEEHRSHLRDGAVKSKGGAHVFFQRSKVVVVIVPVPAITARGRGGGVLAPAP